MSVQLSQLLLSCVHADKLIRLQRVNFNANTTVNVIVLIFPFYSEKKKHHCNCN